MSKTYKRVDAALKGMRHLEIIKEMKENEAAREGVLKWIVENGYEKLFQRCEYEPSSDRCVGVGLRESFHGKKCPSCRREYRNQNYAEKHNKKKKSTTKKRSVSFKKGTKRT